MRLTRKNCQPSPIGAKLLTGKSCRRMLNLTRHRGARGDFMGKTHHGTGQVLQFRRGRAHAALPQSMATCVAASMCGAKACTVAIPGEAVSPDATFRNVWNGTPDSAASRCSCAGSSEASAARTSSGLGVGVRLMKRDSTDIGSSCLPNSVRPRIYPAGMSGMSIKATVIANIELLMQSKYGKRNVTALGRDTGIATGGAQRVLDPATSVGLDLLERVADKFDIDVWQLLVPNLGQSMKLSPAEVEAVRKIREPLQPKGVDIPATVNGSKHEPRRLEDRLTAGAQPGRKSAG